MASSEKETDPAAGLDDQVCTEGERLPRCHW